MTNAQDQLQFQKQLAEYRKTVDTDHYDLTVRELVRMASEGELIRAPPYQRHFRWKVDAESRLIESVFLGIPVPAIFVASNVDGTWELVDGLQRISTLIHYMTDSLEILTELSKEGPLRIGGLQKLTRLNGLTFGQLPTPLRLAFQKRPLRVTVLSDKSDPDVRFDMFERLNNGGIELTPQEVRACVYRGKPAEFLRRLAGNTDFQSLLKLKKGQKDDGTAEEIVLKFFAYLYNRDNFKDEVKHFLNDFMGKSLPARKLDDEEALFARVVAELRPIVGGPLLRKKVHVTPINQLEGVLVGAAEVIRSGGHLSNPPDGWLNDPELVRYSTKGTNQRSSLIGRIERARALLS